MSSKLRVECFGCKDDCSLEAAVNKWLTENSDVEVIDIKFSVSSCVDDRNIYEVYSALILYKYI